jgi:hypothetical protein
MTAEAIKEIVPGSKTAADNFKTEFKKVMRDYAMEDAAARVIADRVAKGVPLFTKGILAANAAFKNRDYMAGSAALMDICSGGAMLIPPPTGPVAGALLTMIGQFLSFYVQQEPPIQDKIEKLLVHLKSEQEKERITAVGHSIASYTTSLITKCNGTTSSKSIAAILAMPLTSESQADDFIVEMKGLKSGLEADKATFSVPTFANWQVAGYLGNQANQRTEGWPEVLGIWCRTYIDLLTANMMLNCLADPKTLDRLINETQETNEKSLPNLTKHTKRKCHTALLNLKSLMSSLPGSWESDKKEMLRIVQAVRPAAQERGMYAHIGYHNGGGVLYVASGSGSKDALKWGDYKHNAQWLNSISIHIPNAEKDSFTPKYEVVTCEYYNKHRPLVGTPMLNMDYFTNIGRHTLDSVTNTLSDRTHMISPGPNQRFLDVSAMALDQHLRIQCFPSDATKQPTALVSLVIENTRDKSVYTTVNLYVIDKDNKSTIINWHPALADAKDVRDLYLPPTTLPDDPDADAMVDNNAELPGPQLLAQNTNIVYAGVRDGNNIHVAACNTWGTVPGPTDIYERPWTSYNGIEVDPYYLWVFGKGGIACATHASIIKCRQGKIRRPSWIHHDYDKQIFPGRDAGGLPEVTSLCPCADGTLVANIQDNIYTADYEIVHAERYSSSRQIVFSSWVKRGGKAKQVIKMPIPCWSMLERLRANLQSG